VTRLLAQGEASRHFGATDMNANSSRSHVMFRLRIKRAFVAAGGGGAAIDWNDPSVPTRESTLVSRPAPPPPPLPPLTPVPLRTSSTSPAASG